MGKLINEKDDKNYQVNLVKISTEKDSIDYRELRQNLVLVDQTVRELNSFLAAKNLSDPRLNMLSKDSISKTRCVHAIIILGGENNTVHSAAMSSITYNFNQLTQDVSTYGY